MKTLVSIVITCVLCLTIGSVPPVFAVTLEILNQSSAYEVTVSQGEPIVVRFAVDPKEYSSRSDLIQLRRIKDELVVSQEERGDDLTGTIWLDTTDSSALGRLKLVYQFKDDLKPVVADQSVFVFNNDLSKAPQEVTVPSHEAPTIQAAINMIAPGGTINL